jgi:hypothetical protein
MTQRKAWNEDISHNDQTISPKTPNPKKPKKIEAQKQGTTINQRGLEGWAIGDGGPVSGISAFQAH